MCKSVLRILPNNLSLLQSTVKEVYFIMATVPEAQDALNKFKMEAASEVGVFLH